MKELFRSTSLAVGLLSGLAAIPAQTATVPGALVRFAGERMSMPSRTVSSIGCRLRRSSMRQGIIGLT